MEITLEQIKNFCFEAYKTGYKDGVEQSQKSIEKYTLTDEQLKEASERAFSKIN
jgi:hypothetical protein